MIEPENSTLLIIDIQQRLMPAINGADAVVGNAKRLIDAASILSVETVVTEQNAEGLGGTVPGLFSDSKPTVLHKKHFDTTKEGEILSLVPADRALIVAGCEAHVCVLQTVLGLREAERRVFIVADAVGARSDHNKRAAIDRMRVHGAEVVTTEMVLFEWLQTSDHVHFKDVLHLVR